MPDRPQRLEEEVTKEMESDYGTALTPEIRERIKAEVKEKLRGQLEAEAREKALREARQKMAERQAPPKPLSLEETFERLDLNIRLQHIVLAVSCLLLIFTGIPIKYHESAWAGAVFQVFGGFQLSRFIHRLGAIGVMIVALWHSYYIFFTRPGRQTLFDLLPSLKDFQDVGQNLMYFFNLTGERPKFARFSYIEKFDYWAVYWGIVIMCGSGLILWFENQAMAYFPKFVMDIAHEAHSDEGLLATCAIVIWHFFNAHLIPSKFPLNTVFWTGRVTAEEMKEDHALEYEQVMARRNAGEMR